MVDSQRNIARPAPFENSPALLPRCAGIESPARHRYRADHPRRNLRGRLLPGNLLATAAAVLSYKQLRRRTEGRLLLNYETRPVFLDSSPQGAWART